MSVGRLFELSSIKLSNALDDREVHVNIDDLIFICHHDLLSDPGSRGFSLETNGQTVEGFIVKNDSAYFAYRNSCPHTGAPLDWVEHQFLDLDESLIQCAVHDARFLIDSGECVFGPCPGERLEKLDIVVLQDGIYLPGDQL
jgi:nitrite reductase/ring-hydroxylating ferredoxin subunit